MSINKLIFALLRPIWFIFDALVVKNTKYWAFSTHHLHTGKFIENQRAVFEYVKKDPKIFKIIFFRGICEEFHIDDAVNYEIVEHGSLRGFWLLAKCKVVFLTHSVSMDFSLRWGSKNFGILPLDMKKRVVVNLWHGIPLKRLFYTSNEKTRIYSERIKYRNKERSGYAGLISSSDIDSYAMAAMFYPLNYLRIWCTGLPRNDFLVCNEEYLPRYIRNSLYRIRKIREERRLVVYAPTYRQTDADVNAYYYQFNDEEICRLKCLLRRHNAILGYRPHYFKNNSKYFNLDLYVDGDVIVDFSVSSVPEFSAIARECDLIVTDYSSVYIEALYLKKPAICFAYDLESYKNQQDGLLYDLSLAFPGPICRNFDEMLSAIDLKLKCSVADSDVSTETAHKIFFSHCDDRNSERVYERVRKELESI